MISVMGSRNLIVWSEGMYFFCDNAIGRKSTTFLPRYGPEFPSQSHSKSSSNSSLDSFLALEACVFYALPHVALFSPRYSLRLLNLLNFFKISNIVNTSCPQYAFFLLFKRAFLAVVAAFNSSFSRCKIILKG